MEIITSEKSLEKKVEIDGTLKINEYKSVKETEYLLLKIDEKKVNGSPILNLKEVIGNSDFKGRININKPNGRWEIKLYYSEKTIDMAKELYDKIESFYNSN